MASLHKLSRTVISRFPVCIVCYRIQQLSKLNHKTFAIQFQFTGFVNHQPVRLLGQSIQYY